MDGLACPSVEATTERKGPSAAFAQFSLSSLSIRSRAAGLGLTITAKLPGFPLLWSRRKLWKVLLPFPKRTRKPGQIQPIVSGLLTLHFGSRLPEIMAMRFITEVVASAQSAADLKVAVRRC